MLKSYFLIPARLFIRKPVIFTCPNRQLSSGYRKAIQRLEKKRLEQEHIDGIVTKKMGDDKLTPASINFVVVGNGGLGVPKSIYIITSEDCYLIGCSEGTPRLASSLEIRSFKPKHIFITSNKWLNTGGLVGLGMGMETSGRESITVHGPPKLEQLFYSSRTFGISAGIKIIYNSMDTVFRDCCFTIDKFELTPSSSSSIKRMKTDDVVKAFNYHFKVNDRIGRLDLNSCIELKIPVGPLLKKLKSGEDIKLPDDRVVTHDEVCAPALPGDEVLIIDCPSVAYIDSLIENEKLHKLIHSENSRLKYVFHYSDVDVIVQQKYQDWVNQFAPNVQHYGLNEFNSNLCHLPVMNQMYNLSKIDADIFKKPFYDEKHRPLPIETRIKPTDLLANFNLGLKMMNKNFDTVKIDYDRLEDEFNQVDGLKTAIEDYKKKVQDLKSVIDYPRITFSGTASAAPSKYRNSSGIYIDINEKESCILDCGEGTLFQFIRQFGPDQYLLKLCNLKFIFITHLHADHHIGLVGILLERERSFSQLNRNPGPVTIFMPDAVFDFLKLYDHNFEPVRHLFNVELLPHRNSMVISEQLAEQIGVQKMEITRVPHCFQSCGVAFTIKTSDNQDYMISYSGDSLPSESLPKIANNSDLLIHEATFSNEFEDDALKKRHSTSEQAIDVRNRANAKFIIMAHFSGRYAKIPCRSSNFDDRSGVAFDHMTVNPDNLKKTSFMLDPLEVLYKEDLDDTKELIERRKQANLLLKKYTSEHKC